MGFGREDKEVVKYKPTPEGEWSARLTDYTTGESKFGDKQQWVKLTWTINELDEDFHNEKVNQFCNLNINAMDAASVAHVYEAIHGEFPPPGKEWKSADHFINELLDSRARVTVQHKTKQMPNKQTGALEDRTFANVVAVAPLRRRAATVSAPVANDDEPPF